MTDVVLHIGTGKTGTSSLQEFLGRNRQRLADAGVLYPRAVGKYRHVRFGFMLTPTPDLERMIVWRRVGDDDPEEFKATVRAELEEEVRTAGLPRLLLSDEGFYGCGPGTLANLRGYLDEAAETVRLVVYLRRQDDHLLSSYQQQVKVGATVRLAAWARRDRSRAYDYARRLDGWQKAIEPTFFAVRPFEREQFAGGSLFQDFLDAAGIAIDETTLESVGRSNVSLDAESVELLRLLNLNRVEHHGATPGRIDNRKLITRVFSRSSGPRLTLPDEILDALMDRCAATNAEVARTYLGRDDGVLFRSSERPANATTRQLLEPARVRELLEEIDYPAAERAAVLRIAEREASP